MEILKVLYGLFIFFLCLGIGWLFFAGIGLILGWLSGDHGSEPLDLSPHTPPGPDDWSRPPWDRTS
jgi:hypothetical protein